jgi:hypothetical protein
LIIAVQSCSNSGMVLLVQPMSSRRSPEHQTQQEPRPAPSDDQRRYAIGRHPRSRMNRQSVVGLAYVAAEPIQFGLDGAIRSVSWPRCGRCLSGGWCRRERCDGRDDRRQLAAPLRSRSTPWM